MYTEKLDNMMRNLEFFTSIYQMPMKNGVNFKTDLFKSDSDYIYDYLKNVGGLAISNYENIVKDLLCFKDELQKFVNQTDFVKRWKSLTWDEKKFLIYFDEDTYGILRGKLTIEEIGLINFENHINTMKINWDEKLVSILDLPVELSHPPQNNLQFMKQVKKLKSLGFMDDELTDFIKVRETRVDMMPNKLTLLFMKNKDYSEKVNILMNVSSNIDFSVNYLTSFISNEEKKLTKNKLTS